MTLRYRVHEPDTPSELPLELMQEWESEIALEVGMAWEMRDGEAWEVVAVDPDPDPTYLGRVFLTRRGERVG